MRDKILERAEHEASGISLPPATVTHSGSGDGRLSHDEVGLPEDSFLKGTAKNLGRL